MVEANNHGAALTIIERNFLGLAAVELALLVAKLVLLGNLEGGLAAAGLGHGVGDLRELRPGVFIDLLLDLDALYRSVLGLLRLFGRLFGGGVRRGGRDDGGHIANHEGAQRKCKHSTQGPLLEVHVKLVHIKILSLIHRTSQP